MAQKQLKSMQKKTKNFTGTVRTFEQKNSPTALQLCGVKRVGE